MNFNNINNTCKFCNNSGLCSDYHKTDHLTPYCTLCIYYNDSNAKDKCKECYGNLTNMINVLNIYCYFNPIVKECK